MPNTSHIICKIDNSEHPSVESVHKYLRKFHIKQEDYYTQYFPRYDRLTNELISFKNYDQYFSQEFANKNNLKKWLKQNPLDGLNWAKNWLIQRKSDKNLVYAPSEVELRSLSTPSMSFYEDKGGYYRVTKELGFVARYTDTNLISKPLSPDSVIITDTREQKELKIAHKTIKECVNVGDYALAGDDDLGIRVERKSIGDFASTLSQGFDRFERELQRAVDNELYVVMLVESSMNDTLGFNYLPQMQWTRVTPAHVFKNLRDLLLKFPLHFQVVFVDGREEAAKKIIKIFELGNKVKIVDLQWKLEKGEL